jgi:putative heme-binding domain-containing protein
MNFERRRIGRVICMLTIALLGWFATGIHLNAQERQEGNVDPVELDNGARVFSETCSVCHGPDGNQISGVDLKSGHLRRATTDDQLAHIIQSGIPGTMMPPNNLSSRNLLALISYLHAMRDFKTRKVTMGSPEKGRLIFEGKGGCLSCHRVNNKGSYIALDLSAVGSVRSPSYLEDTLLDPASTDIPANRFVHVVTRNGTIITGRRINEDTLTIQLMDSKQQLISLQKADLKSNIVEKMPVMTSYKDKLTDAERADLIGYLASLQGPKDAPRAIGGRP